MAADYFVYLLIVLFTQETKTNKLHFKIPDEDNNFTTQSHLEFESVRKFCSHRNDACRSNNTNICAGKMMNEKMVYKNFENGCFLFLSNMCDHPGDEYFIAASGSCEQYLTERRYEEPQDVPTATADVGIGNNTNSTETNFSDNETVADGALRERKKKLSRLYDIFFSFDGHWCPYSCPTTYSPECVSVNRGYGKYFKMLNFINHCSADIYYCNHWKEFDKPPDFEEPHIQASPLSWSRCGAPK